MLTHLFINKYFYFEQLRLSGMLTHLQKHVDQHH